MLFKRKKFRIISTALIFSLLFSALSSSAISAASVHKGSRNLYTSLKASGRLHKVDSESNFRIIKSTCKDLSEKQKESISNEAIRDYGLKKANISKINYITDKLNPIICKEVVFGNNNSVCLDKNNNIISVVNFKSNSNISTDRTRSVDLVLKKFLLFII